MKNWERIRARLARDCGVALTRGGGRAKTGRHGDRRHTGGDMGHIGHTERHETHIEQGHTDMRHAIPETFTRQTLRDKKSHVRWVLPKIALTKT